MDAFLKRAGNKIKEAPAQAAASENQPMMDMAAQRPKYVPWIEKYRPNKIEDVSHQVEVVQALKMSVENGKVPHLLMYGPPGTGKTSTVLALAKDLFGADFYRSRVLELNASDERGILVVREKIKKFAQRKISRHPDGRDVPQLQFIILDEADSMTIDAQAALRRIIEAYSATTRFCIICNYISKIIDPLASRCVKFRFSPISEVAQKERLLSICEIEGVKIESEKVIDKLIHVTEGDLRRSINTLQTCASFKNEEGLTEAQVDSISGVIPKKAIIMIDTVLSTRGATYADIQRVAEELIFEGYDCQ